MEQALQALFDAFKQEAPKTKTDQHTDGCTVEKEFSFDLDADGHASLKKSGHGFGKSATCSAWIEAPEDATFSLSIDSNDGDHYHWDNIQTGQNVNFKVHTKTFDSTSVTIELQSTASNVTGTGKLCCNL